MAPLQRFLKLTAEKQARILGAATVEFVAHGYSDASLNRIIREAGISKGAMYYYFEDKDDLFVTVLREFEARLAEGLDFAPEHLTAETFWPTLAAWTRHVAAFGMENPDLVGIGRAFYDIPQSGRFDGTMGRYMAERMEQATAIAARGQALGQVRTDLPAEQLIRLWMAVNAVLDEHTVAMWELVDESERERLVEVQHETLRRLLEKETPVGPE